MNPCPVNIRNSDNECIVGLMPCTECTVHPHSEIFDIRSDFGKIDFGVNRDKFWIDAPLSFLLGVLRSGHRTKEHKEKAKEIMESRGNQ